MTKWNANKASVRLSLAVGYVTTCVMSACTPGAPNAATAASPHGALSANVPAWVRASDANTRVLLNVDAKFNPEQAAQLGVDGIDGEIADRTPGHLERERAARRVAMGELERRRALETDPRVRDDIAILLQATERNIRFSEIEERTTLPYENLTETLLGQLEALLDDRIPEARRVKALVRIRRYAGLEAGYTPMTGLVQAEILAKLDDPSIAKPYRRSLEKHLATNGVIRDGIGELFAKYKIAGYEEPCRVLMEQLVAYDGFVRTTVLPKASDAFALPPALYAVGLESFGVDRAPADLARTARAAFTEMQGEIQTIATAIAKERKLPNADYREVIRLLKTEQVVGAEIVPLYKARLAEIEAIVRRENLVTLPMRPASIRLATDAESAALPSPHMRPPRLLGNTGEQGEFVLPLTVPATEGATASDASAKLDDFTFAAASWTLTAHEARPGHEMQFASIIERGVSSARAIYAGNSANIEGWGVYSEAMIFPYMSKEGQLISMQLRMMRAARAFLDPELQTGGFTFDSARTFLEHEVGLSHAFATSEVERYTFRMPGQATSYFYGYIRLLEIRREIETKLGARFDRRKFHDAVLAVGLLPPTLLRDAVLRELGE